MATFYANAGGSTGAGDGSTPSDECEAWEFAANDAVLYQSVVDGDICYVRASPGATLDTATQRIVTFKDVSIGNPIVMEGYTTTPGDGGQVSWAVTDSGSLSALGGASGHDGWEFRNLRFVGGYRGVTWDGNGWVLQNICVEGCSNDAFDATTGTGDVGFLSGCAAINCGADGFVIPYRAAVAVDCVAVGCSGTGFEIGNPTYGGTAIRCVAFGNGGDGFDCPGETVFDSCMAVGNSGDGFDVAQSPSLMTNCVAADNGQYGLRATGLTRLVNCMIQPDDLPNTSGGATGNYREISPVTGDADFTDASPGDAADVDLTTLSTSALRGIEVWLGGDGFTGFAAHADVGVDQRADEVGGGGGGLAPAQGLQSIGSGVVA